MSAHRRVLLPRVVLTELLGTPLTIAVCQECPWATPPVDRASAALARADHRMKHKRGQIPVNPLVRPEVFEEASS